jgi:hypothetical protein
MVMALESLGSLITSDFVKSIASGQQMEQGAT